MAEAQRGADAAACPYVGVRAYEEADRHLFVGREQESELVLNKVLAERLTVLFAPSGVGKSSLLRAGVVPKLREICSTVEVHYVDDWVADNHVADLRSVVARFVEREPRETAEDETRLLLLALDQFEQLLTRAPVAHVEELVAYLAELAHGKLAVRIVICLRAEFLARLDAFRDVFPAFMRGRYSLPVVSRQQAMRILIEPALRFEVTWDSTLVDTLLDDFSNESAQDEFGESRMQLSFLSEILKRIWARLPEHATRIEPNLYRGRDEEMRGMLEDVWSSPDERELDVASRVVCKLAPPSGRKAPCTIAELASEPDLDLDVARAVLVHMQKHWLVRLREQSAIQWYELVHDSLAPFLRSWAEKHMLRIRERTALAKRRALSRQKRKRQAWQLALGLAASCALAWLVWQGTEGLRIQSANRAALRTIRLHPTSESASLITARAKLIWSTSSIYGRGAYVYAWLAESRALLGSSAGTPGNDRVRPIGDGQKCDVSVSPDAEFLSPTIDRVWRKRTQELRRVQIPARGQPTICVVRRYGAATVSLEAGEGAGTSVQDAFRLKSDKTPPTPQGSSPSGGAQLEIIRPPRPELGWNSVLVESSDELRSEGPDELVKLCDEQPAFSSQRWPAGACQLPGWTRPLLELEHISHKPLSSYLEAELDHQLKQRPAFVWRSASFEDLLAASTEYDGAAQCVVTLLKKLSLRAFSEKKLLPALSALGPQVGAACQRQAATADDGLVNSVWDALSLGASSRVESRGICPGIEAQASAHANAKRRNQSTSSAERGEENLYSILTRVTLYPRVQVNLGPALTRCEGDASKRCLFDESGQRSPALLRALQDLERSLHARSGVVLPRVRFSHVPDLIGRKVAIDPYSACISQPVTVDAPTTGVLARWLADAVGDAVLAERAAYLQQQDVTDASALLGVRTRDALRKHGDTELLQFMRHVAASDDEQVSGLLSRATPLLSLVPLLDTLGGRWHAWLPVLASATAEPRAPAEERLERAVESSLAAIRGDRPSVASQTLSRANFPSERVAHALGRAYPRHVASTMLAIAEKACHSLQASEWPAFSDQALAQLMSWSVETTSGLDQGAEGARAARARLCLLHAAVEQGYRFAPSPAQQWSSALAAVAGLGSDRGDPSFAQVPLTVLTHAEAASQSRIPPELLDQLVKLALTARPAAQWDLANTLSKVPASAWRLQTALSVLERSKNFGTLQQGLSWNLLEGLETPEVASRIQVALEQMSASNPTEHEILAYVSALAALRLDQFAVAEALLEPLASGASTPLIRAWARHQLVRSLRQQKKFDQALNAAIAMRESSAEPVQRCLGWLHVLQLTMARAEPDHSLLEAEDCKEEDPANRLFSRAWVGLSLGDERAEYDATEFISKGDGYADYVRILMAARRARAGDRQGSELVVAERWQSLQSEGAQEGWSTRMQRGDVSVWREMLIGYWAGALPEKDILEPLQDDQAFRRSAFADLGLTLSSLRAEGYFYVGLKASAEGRWSRARELWLRVTQQGRPEYIEYALSGYYLRTKEVVPQTRERLASATEVPAGGAL